MGVFQALSLLDHAKKDNSLIPNHLLNGVHLLFSKLYYQNKNLILDLKKNKDIERKEGELIAKLQQEKALFLDAIEFYCVGTSKEEVAFYLGSKAFFSCVHPAVRDKFLSPLLEGLSILEGHEESMKILDSWIRGYNEAMCSANKINK